MGSRSGFCQIWSYFEPILNPWVKPKGHGNSFCTVILNCMNVIAALMKHAALLSAYWGEPERSPTLLSSMHSVNQVSVDEIIV